MEGRKPAKAEIRQLYVLTLQRDAMALRVRRVPLGGLEFELAWQGSNRPLKLGFVLTGWERLCEFAYALEQAMAGQLLKVAQWSDLGGRVVLQVFYRMEDHGDGDLKGRIYLRIARSDSEDDRLRIRLTRLDAYKLRALALKEAGLA